jgi:alcohol dehydrogenase (cytochrome c)
MRTSSIALLAGLGILCASAAATAKEMKAYSPVSQERLLKPEPQNWLMTRGRYEGWSYSELAQITNANVHKLRPVWAFSTGVDSGHQAPPIVNDGVMFVTTPNNQIIALDAQTGDEFWRYRRELPEGFSALHNTNRGPALWEDKVYVATLDAYLVALDAKTGTVVWETQVGDWETGQYMTIAPLIVNGKVMVGISGGEFGVRGYVAAYDANTGKEVWKTYTIPEPGQPGSETWRGDDWKRGGASVWMPGVYDPVTNVVLFGTGNAAPWFGDQRPGDNLYTSSTIALDPDTGQLKGYFQYHWNDSWDWDEMNAPIVADYEYKGRKIHGLIKTARNGYLYWLELNRDGSISFVDAKPYVHQNVFKSIDPKTGRPEYNEDRKPGTGKRAEFCPSLWGGKDWPFDAWNPELGMLYIPANDNHCGSLEGKIQEYVPGQWWTGVDIPDIGFHVVDGAKSFGEIQAWDMSKGEKVWTELYAHSMNWGSILATAGDVIFAGGTNDRYFRAYDAKTGEQLWQFRANSGIISPPSTYMVDGVQYVSVVAGWGTDPQFQQGLLSNLLGWEKAVPEGGVIWTFALAE